MGAGGGIGNYYSAPENNVAHKDYEVPIHTAGTHPISRGDNKIGLWFAMYNPPYSKAYRLICGICHQEIAGLHCATCFPNKKDACGFPADFNIIVKGE